MPEETYTLQLTKGELLVLQELTEDMELGYTWIRELADSLREKVLASYQKPPMSMEEYRMQLEKERKFWQGEPAEAFMVRAKERELRFYYDVEQEP